ncbi:MAG: hypothetical protein WBE26_05015 [Phycisphaerae bacterium]
MLRRLLPINLRFLARADLQGLDRVHVVFDRLPQRKADVFTDQIRQAFATLPLHFQFHPFLPGRIVQFVNHSKFYASLNWVLGLRTCQTRYAVLHDFDLYPLVPDFFVKIVQTMRERSLRFSGVEHTRFDGLTPSDGLIGTWELGIDVAWLRDYYRPIDCFHAIAKVNGRYVDLDPFSWIQSRTNERALSLTVAKESYAHVQNLCSTYLLYSAGRKVRVAWQLHFLWYLENVAGCSQAFEAATQAMEMADSPQLTVGSHPIDYSQVHVTCANVLRHEVTVIERALFGSCRPEVERFLTATEDFLQRHGSSRPLPHWKPGTSG